MRCSGAGGVNTGSLVDCSRSYCTQPLSLVRLLMTRSLYSSLNLSGSATWMDTHHRPQTKHVTRSAPEKRSVGRVALVSRFRIVHPSQPHTLYWSAPQTVVSGQTSNGGDGAHIVELYADAHWAVSQRRHVFRVLGGARTGEVDDARPHQSAHPEPHLVTGGMRDRAETHMLRIGFS